MLVVLVAGCAAPPIAPVPEAPALKYRACQSLPPKLPPVRSIEALKRRHDELELKLLDCAERLRLAVDAYDELKARK